MTSTDTTGTEIAGVTETTAHPTGAEPTTAATQKAGKPRHLKRMITGITLAAAAAAAAALTSGVTTASPSRTSAAAGLHVAAVAAQIP